jgi:hypothetical protein
LSQRVRHQHLPCHRVSDPALKGRGFSRAETSFHRDRLEPLRKNSAAKSQ